jgi:quinoprotein glucose dehydrogenase
VSPLSSFTAIVFLAAACLKGITKADDSLRNILRHGRGIMPAFPQFSNLEIRALISFLKSDFNPGDQKVAGSRVRYSVEIPFFVDPYGAPAISPHGERLTQST